jgi:hypothetical protein
MSTVSSVPSVTSPSGVGSAHGAGNVTGPVHESPETTSGSLLPETPGPLSSTLHDVPLGTLMAVREPSGSNARAALDYQELRIALESNNLAAAQKAYANLQNDLMLANSTQPATGNEAAGIGSQLNTAV